MSLFGDPAKDELLLKSLLSISNSLDEMKKSLDSISESQSKLLKVLEQIIDKDSICQK